MSTLLPNFLFPTAKVVRRRVFLIKKQNSPAQKPVLPGRRRSTPVMDRSAVPTIKSTWVMDSLIAPLAPQFLGASSSSAPRQAGIRLAEGEVAGGVLVEQRVVKQQARSGKSGNRRAPGPPRPDRTRPRPRRWPSAARPPPSPRQGADDLPRLQLKAETLDQVSVERQGLGGIHHAL